MSPNRPPLWVVLKAHLLADPRKTGVLVTLCLVMALVYGRMMWTSYRPGDASAEDMVIDAASQAGSGQPAPGSALPPARTRIPLSVPLTRELARNPFVMGQGVQPPDADAAGADGIESDPPDAVVGAVPQELGGLVLQSTLCGPTPVACISGRVVRTGDAIDGFTVEHIGPTQVVLSRQGVPAVLDMK